MKWGLFFASITLCVHAFHDTDNVLYDCWPLGAREGAATIDCGGLGMEWPEEPPDEVEVHKKFNITYHATIVTGRFYSGNLIFPNKSVAAVTRLCHNTTCPESTSQANEDNCCVWHANIHVCHPSVTAIPKICGPWVGHDGLLASHTAAEVGSIDSTFFSEQQINYVGQNFIIAHLRVGNIQIALGKTVKVIAARVCGDGVCTAEIGETCESCAADCCGISFPVGATAGIVVFCLLIPGIVVLAVLGWYYFQRRKLFFDEGWIINYDDIVKRDYKAMAHMGSLGSIKRSRDSIKRDSREPLSKLAVADSNQSTHWMGQLFIPTGTYEGRAVAIKKMKRNDLLLSNTVRKEVLQIRMLDHPNLCKFIGATIKNIHNLCIISEYCPKGSLNDVLQNDDIPLNWGFRFSFASDTARGMAYLHSKKIYHGRLTSSNCTIDDRWVLKIADYGLPTFRHTRRVSTLKLKAGSCDYRDEEDRNSTTRLYQPPENRGVDLVMPTLSADVYSYAVILVEIATRMDPFSEASTVAFLDASSRPSLSRSQLTTSDSPCPCPDQYLDLINRCWAYHPSSRPSFDHIRRIVDRINPSRESPVDMMMIMMEKYSKHLESLVAERTQELIAEQRKTAALLYSMLPRPIADDLKQGMPAPAKLFHSATIYFSDIVGFTSLASSSTPFEIIALLNELYSAFDDILDQFDVYKVETIGDAYMVVSGVPQENGDSHAGEIASMSLSLLSAVKKFTIPHRPDEKLEIRIGIHSGPVCAGVVGLKMPRYCLFGDTVNTASRMESNSQAMRIQCSDATYQLLSNIGTFNLECRGNIEIKGKGSMVTWWLIGERQERPSRDSLTGINMCPRSESALVTAKTSDAPLVAKSQSTPSAIRNKGTTHYSHIMAINPIAVSARDQGLTSQHESDHNLSLPGSVTDVQTQVV